MFTFSSSDTEAGLQVTHTTHAVSLDEVINAFEYFLRGAGFHFEGEHLELVPDDTAATDFKVTQMSEGEQASYEKALRVINSRIFN